MELKPAIRVVYSDPVMQALHEVHGLVMDQRRRLDALDAEIARLKADIQQAIRNTTGSGVTG